MSFPIWINAWRSWIHHGMPDEASAKLWQATPLEWSQTAQIMVRMIWRKGSNSDETIPALLSTAETASGLGIMPCSIPAQIRAEADDMARACKVHELWHPEKPLWWEPLPEPGPIETTWCRVAATLEAAWHRHVAHKPNRPWLHLPAFLSGLDMAAWQSQLQDLLASGAFSLVRAGVGEKGLVRDVRTDSVVYLDGREPWLVQNIPEMAALVTWCRLSLPSLLEETSRFDTKTGVLRAPQKAMLAVYPAPSHGYQRHVDNPGGEHENGRAVTLVMYLNEPNGGSISLFDALSPSDEPVVSYEPRTGNAVLFNSRSVPHAVAPITAGDSRWALSVWFNDLFEPEHQPVIPEITPQAVIQRVEGAPLPEGRVLIQSARENDWSIRSVNVSSTGARLGIVSTVYGAGAWLPAWCEYHLSMGVEHIVLIFDHPGQASESAAMASMRQAFPPEQLTVWGADEAPWQALPDTAFVGDMRRLADGGGRTSAICARQSLNAGAALAAVQRGILPGLDWLVHMDADEYLSFLDKGGGDAHEHAAALNQSGYRHVRYFNHELLLADVPGRPRFKKHPMLAEQALGTVGWRKVRQALGCQDEAAKETNRTKRYFAGYLNGKGAVAVQHGRMGAVHGWLCDDPDPPVWLVGPFILHAHNPNPQAFSAKMRRRYLDTNGATTDRLDVNLFHPGVLDREAQAILAKDPAADLGSLYRQRTVFSTSSVELMDEADLLIEPPSELEMALNQQLNSQNA